MKAPRRRAVRGPHALGLATAVLLSFACVQARWVRVRLEEPPPAGAVERIAAGESELADCLALLGAPNEVWELGSGGMALAWAWDDTWDWNFSVSVAAQRGGPAASFALGDAWVDVESVVVLLDGDWRVREVRRGRLPDVAPERRRRSEAPDADDGAQPGLAGPGPGRPSDP